MTEAPSIKEALELKPCPFCGGEAEFSEKRLKRRTYVVCATCHTTTRTRGDHLEASKHWNTRATLQSSGERREAIARILEPQAWAALGIGDTLAYKNRRTSSLRKADRILASGLVQDEAAIPDGYALVPIKPTMEMLQAGADSNPTDWNDGTDPDFAIDVASDVYTAMVRAAIRSDRDGGKG